MRTYKITHRLVGELDAYTINIPRHVASTFDPATDRFVCTRDGNKIIYQQVELVEKKEAGEEVRAEGDPAFA